MIFIKFYFQRTFRIRITLLNTINIENNLFLSDLIFIVTYTNIISFNFFLQYSTNKLLCYHFNTKLRKNFYFQQFKKTCFNYLSCNAFFNRLLHLSLLVQFSKTHSLQHKNFLKSLFIALGCFPLNFKHYHLKFDYAIFIFLV